MGNGSLAYMNQKRKNKKTAVKSIDQSTELIKQMLVQLDERPIGPLLVSDTIQGLKVIKDNLDTAEEHVKRL
jgi:hypothetical protein